MNKQRCTRWGTPLFVAAYSFTRSRATATSLTLVPVGPVNTRPLTSFRAL